MLAHSQLTMRFSERCLMRLFPALNALILSSQYAFSERCLDSHSQCAFVRSAVSFLALQCAFSCLLLNGRSEYCLIPTSQCAVLSAAHSQFPFQFSMHSFPVLNAPPFSKRLSECWLAPSSHSYFSMRISERCFNPQFSMAVLIAVSIPSSQWSF